LIVKPLLVALLAAAAWPAAAIAQAPPGPPGPPPGGGTDLPSSPGSAPAAVPPGAAAAIPDATGPGLLSSERVALNRARRTFSVRLACQSNGTVRVRSARVAATDIAHARYRCASGRATARLSVTPKIAKRLARRRTVAATGIVRQGGQDARVYFELSSGRVANPAKGFWTDGHLQCAPGYLVEPDFTAKSTIPISTRGWVAWYTPTSGWHWLGSAGENAGRWNSWTASDSGVQQFHPNGTAVPVPWTLGPIAFPAGRGISAVGVYEIVYWVGGRPDYQWQYVNAGTTGAVAAGAATHYCVYP
jgi:hypothetical protein